MRRSDMETVMARTILIARAACPVTVQASLHDGKSSRPRLLASSALSGGTLRGLALVAGVSIAATALGAVPATAQQSLNGGTATGANAYASGTGAIATGDNATATGALSNATGT